MTMKETCAEVGTPNKPPRKMRDPIYAVWCNMKARCQNPKDPDYPRYGGRGITICLRWMRFENFRDDMGPRPSKKHKIERLHNDGNYEPNNCAWATQIEQSRNRSSNVIVEYAGVSQTIVEHAAQHGLLFHTARHRLLKGIPLDAPLRSRHVRSATARRCPPPS